MTTSPEETKYCLEINKLINNFMNKKIEEMSVENLKAMAYDSLRFIEAYQSQLRAINEQIMKKENELNTPKNPEPEMKDTGEKKK